ncbi:MAG: glycosyltransferase family 2 protein, partial [Bacteroidales bacterium]|nr:glycosyltransferase family 2 protein [Bacteroidales bacterium]
KKTLFIRRLYDTLAFFQSLASLHFGDAKAIIRAHNHFRTMRKQYAQPATRNLLKAYPEGRRNIILEYYLHGHKTYPTLTTTR